MTADELADRVKEHLEDRGTGGAYALTDGELYRIEKHLRRVAELEREVARLREREFDAAMKRFATALPIGVEISVVLDGSHGGCVFIDPPEYERRIETVSVYDWVTTAVESERKKAEATHEH